MDSQKKLLTLIAKTELDIENNKLQLVENKLYFSNLIEKNRGLLEVLIVPALALGWVVGRRAKSKKWLPKLNLFTILPQMKKYSNLIKLLI